MTRPGRDVVIAVALAAIALIVFFPGLLFFHQAVFAQDTWVLHIPAKTYFADRLHHGGFPLWYPYDGLGVPYVQTAVLGAFHPFGLLYLFLDAFTALSVSLLCTVAIAIVATYLLARRLGASFVGAAVAALAFGLSGPVVSSLVNVPFAVGIAGFPVLLCGAHLIAVGPRRGLGVAIVAAAVANAVLIGDVEALYLYALVGLPFVVALRHDVGPLRAAIFLGSAGVLGLALSAVQLLPSLSIVGVTGRGRALQWASATKWSVHPLRLPGIFAGDLLQFHAAGPTPNIGSLFGLHGSPWLFSLDVGAVVGVGIVWALGLRGGGRRARWVLGSTALVLVWIAVGRYGGLYWVLFHVLPGFDRFRYPAKVLAYGELALALLAGLGVSRAIAEPRRGIRQVLVVLGVLLVAAGIVAVVFAEAPVTMPAVMHTYLGRLARGLSTAALVAALLASLLAVTLWVHTARTRLLATSAMILVGLADLVVANGHVLGLVSGDPALLDEPGPFETTLLARDGPGFGRYRVATLIDRLHLPRVPGSGDGYLAYAHYKRVALVPDLPALSDIGTIQPYLPATTMRLMRLIAGRSGAFLRELAPLYGTRYLVTTPHLRDRLQMSPTLEMARLPQLGLVLTRYPPAQVRARAFVAVPRYVAGLAEAERALSSPDVRDGRVAVVETKARQPANAPASLGGTARILSYAPESVDVAVGVPEGGDSVLVLNDAWYPGWHASLDGEPSPILPANVAVRGVLVPPGHHVVRFRYPVPASMWTGGAVSAISLLGLVIAMIVLRRRSVRASRRPIAS